MLVQRISVGPNNYVNHCLLSPIQTYAEMDPTTAALEKEHEAVSIQRSCN